VSGNGEEKNLFSGKSVAKNTVYNLLGMGLPLILAVALIPPLISGFGEERFGILNLAWIVIGYFSLFDFGIGRTLTKIVAEKLGLKKNGEIPSLFWTSMFMMLGVSIVGMFIFFYLSPILVYDILNISVNLQQETLNTFYLIAFSIPIVTTSAGLRGVLEAYQKFGIVNVIRVILGAFTFIGPLVCLIFSDSLFWVVLFLIFLRMIVWGVYLFYCFKLVAGLRNEIRFNTKEVKPIVKLSGWMTLSNLLGPLITYSDRFLIGALLSTAAITYYATPYEFITRMLLIPSAVVGVLFPVFSASFINNPVFSRKLFLTGIKFILIIAFPVILFIVTFAYEGMYLWLGQAFAENSSLVLQFLALGILFNSIAFFPYTFLQSTGKAHVPAYLYIAELPVYLILMWYGIRNYGINGAAFIWLVRMVIDSALLLFFTNKIIKIKLDFRYPVLALVLLCSLIPLLLDDLMLKTIVLVLIMSVFILYIWKYFLQKEEKLYFNLAFLRKSYNG
jgi:O-antigen/teichoic acid export membrane protein